VDDGSIQLRAFGGRNVFAAGISSQAISIQINTGLYSTLSHHKKTKKAKNEGPRR
jgi:hypothetical protein